MPELYQKRPSHLESEFLVPPKASQASYSVSATGTSGWTAVRWPQPVAGPRCTEAGESVAAAHITGPLGLAAQFLVELVELTEGQSPRVEAHRQHHLLRQGTGREQSFLSLARSNPLPMRFTAPSRRKHMNYTTTNAGLADADTGGGC